MDQTKTKCKNCREPIKIPENTKINRCPKCKNLVFPPQKSKPSSSDMQIRSQKSSRANSVNRRTWSSSPVERFYSTRPRKRALLCGVTYKSWKNKLLGPINDVYNMRDLLINYYDFPLDSIRILTEEEADSDRIPTEKNIERSLQWLVDGSESGDSLVFFFSGHGSRQPDLNRDEQDGFDETICPVDFMEEGMILDNEINPTIVCPLQKGVRLNAIVDACHGGTILDLQYVCHHNTSLFYRRLKSSMSMGRYFDYVLTAIIAFSQQ